MIDVENLTKRYAGHTAVTDVSFTVRKGEVVGLLGPNGAGKSTILRILSSFMPATSGSVRVAGYDVFREADEVRSRIGYMPENNPLHKEMRVREYLKFRAGLKKLRGNRLFSRLDTVLQQCGLVNVHRKMIGHLSKGYQQRVGLADALINQPDLLILDEPTIGLDPNQIRLFRKLIKDLAKQHTVLISTHILPEVEMTCNRVIILHEGKILAADTPSNLQQIMGDGNQVVAEIAAPTADLRTTWDEHTDVAEYNLAQSEGEYVRCALTPRPGVDLRSMVFEVAKEKQWPLRELTANRHSLEDIFVHITRADHEDSF